MNNIKELLSKHAGKGNYDNVKECLKSEIQDMLLIIMLNAVEHSKFNILEKFLEEEGLLLDCLEFILFDIIKKAASTGKLEVIKLLYDNEYYDEIDVIAMHDAIIYNHPHIVYWLVENNYYPTLSDVDFAIKNGNTSLVEFFKSKEFYGT